MDARGKKCPIPVVLAKKEIDAGNANFTVLVDNQTAVQNLSRLAESQKYSVSVEDMERGFRVEFSGTGSCPECEEILRAPSTDGSWLLFVSKETIGSGSDELGKNLMKMFFYTLTQNGRIPETIIFMNGGVKLPVQEEQIVEHLQVLQEKGSQILVCGTCLNYYELAPQLKIGTVSNMYEIAEKLLDAPKVISL